MRERERERERDYRRKIKESPATTLFEEINVLQPPVSKCLFGWPTMIQAKTKVKKKYFPQNIRDSYDKFFIGVNSLWTITQELK
jgi:hypothetical protein